MPLAFPRQEGRRVFFENILVVHGTNMRAGIVPNSPKEGDSNHQLHTAVAILASAEEHTVEFSVGANVGHVDVGTIEDGGKSFFEKVGPVVVRMESVVPVDFADQVRKESHNRNDDRVEFLAGGDSSMQYIGCR
jgi:hypothetical protein